MAGPSDKARFYLEQSISELNELERKKVFTNDEIITIAKKRSDFEHVINARGSSPSDYVRYVEFEMNLETLRRKRVKRLRIKAMGSGQKRIFFLFSRGTKKFSGDLRLWMQYIEFARKEGAYRKLNEMLTALARLHPTKPEVWIYAARYFMDTQADITNARSYMQRGLRFCKTSKIIWLEYARLEMLYIAKIASRQKILGLEIDRPRRATKDNLDSDIIALPDITAEDINPSLARADSMDNIAIQNLEMAPVLTGAIPIAVFDAGMKDFAGDLSFAKDFFVMLAEFDRLPCIRRVLQHVTDFLQETSPSALETMVCLFQAPIIGIHSSTPGFPKALRECFNRLNSSLDHQSQHRSQLLHFAIRWIVNLVRQGQDMDIGMRRVLSSSLRKYCQLLEASTHKTNGKAVQDLIVTFRSEGRVDDAKLLVDHVYKQSDGKESLLQALTPPAI